MVECEYLTEIRKSIEYWRFNRYMVECEYNNGGVHVDTMASFNRYMVECESGIHSTCSKGT